MKTKLITLILSIVLSSSMLIGCSNDEAETTNNQIIDQEVQDKGITKEESKKQEEKKVKKTYSQQLADTIVNDVIKDRNEYVGYKVMVEYFIIFKRYSIYELNPDEFFETFMDGIYDEYVEFYKEINLEVPSKLEMLNYMKNYYASKMDTTNVAYTVEEGLELMQYLLSTELSSFDNTKYYFDIEEGSRYAYFEVRSDDEYASFNKAMYMMDLNNKHMQCIVLDEDETNFTLMFNLIEKVQPTNENGRTYEEEQNYQKELKEQQRLEELKPLTEEEALTKLNYYIYKNCSAFTELQVINNDGVCVYGIIYDTYIRY